MSVPLETDATEIEGPEPAVPYRALCPSAVLSVVLGVLSIGTALSWYLTLVPLLGIWLGRRAMRRIREAPDQWTGLELARVGLGLSVGFWILGAGWLYSSGGGVPYGYQLVRYDELQPDSSDAAEPIPQTARDLQDKRIFVKGYMQPRRKQSGIKEFVLCPNNGECAYCIPNPKPTEKIRVLLQGDLRTFYTTGLIGVGGRFQVDPADPGGIPYTLEADCIR